MVFSESKMQYWAICALYDAVKKEARVHYQTQSHYLYLEYEPKLRTKRGWKLHNDTFQQKETLLKESLYRRLAKFEAEKQKELSKIY